MATATIPIPATPTESPEAPKKLNILDKAMYLTIHREWPPKSKTIKDKSIVQTTGQPGMFSLSKKLWDCPQMKAIENNEILLDNFIKAHACSMPLRSGSHLVPKILYHEMKAAFIAHKAKREELIDAFVDAYDKALEHSKELLGDQFLQSDYPTKEEIKSLFYFGADWLNYGPNEELQQIDEEMAELQAQRIENEVHQAVELHKDELRKEMQGIVTHLIDRFTPREVEGELKRKIIRDTVLDKMIGFKELFPAKNLAQDSKLQELVNQADALLTGVSPDKLRDDDSMREAVQKGFEVIKQNIDQLLVDEPVRSISFSNI